MVEVGQGNLSALWLAESTSHEHCKDNEGNDSRNEDREGKRYDLHVSQRSKNFGKEEAVLGS